jgi:hypothetical protein
MEKGELIITTAKEIFLKTYLLQREHNVDQRLADIDKVFKALTKTVTEAYLVSCRIQ